MNEFLQGSAFFSVALTILVYWFATIFCSKIRIPLLNPLVVSILVTAVIILPLGIEPQTYSKGAGYILYFLPPATVCLAIPMYKQMKILRENLSAVLIAVFVGAFTSLAIIFLSNFIFILSPEMFNSILPKSVTVAVALGISSEISGISSITVLCVCVSGITGTIILHPLCKFLRITDPISQGLAAGTASHILGTAKAMELGSTQGALGSLAVVVCAVFTVILVPLFSIAV